MEHSVTTGGPPVGSKFFHRWPSQKLRMPPQWSTGGTPSETSFIEYAKNSSQIAGSPMTYLVDAGNCKERENQKGILK